jgi:hypothetical protein
MEADRVCRQEIQSGTQGLKVGSLITDATRLNATLKNCDVNNSGEVQYWQLLLQLNAMPGAPSNVDVLACHFLDGSQNR